MFKPACADSCTLISNIGKATDKKMCEECSFPTDCMLKTQVPYPQKSSRNLISCIFPVNIYIFPVLDIKSGLHQLFQSCQYDLM